MLALLGERLAEMRGGRGRLVLISGEAGIGKTALLDAFTRRLPRGTLVLRGACDPVVPGRAFAPLIDMAAQLRDGLRTALASADRDRVFEHFIAILRAHSPGCVAIFENLHWADSATLDLLRVVGRRLPTIPVLCGRAARSRTSGPSAEQRARPGRYTTGGRSSAGAASRPA